jgi:hypothetical protein
VQDINITTISKAIEEVSNHNLNKNVKAVYLLECDHPGESKVREAAENERNDPRANNPITQLKKSEIKSDKGPIGTGSGKPYEHDGKIYPAYVEIEIRAEKLYYVGKTDSNHPIGRVFEHVTKSSSANFFERGFYPVRLIDIYPTDNASRKEVQIADAFTDVDFKNEVVDSINTYAYYG